MPPIRTIPPTKALKTERTHEENQERAYIAASRRSDRSLEARVESARRASEIHKRRTGRSLRVTEQDVVNEEMYEEEDDDLPMQYRRLTAHLQTGSADFNRRLSAYLTNHVAMRSALDQAITNSYAAQYPNAPQFAHNQQNMFPSPFLPQNASQQPSPASYQPYPTPGHPNYRPTHQARPSSVSQRPSSSSYSPNLPTPVSNQSSPTDERRRTSAASSTSSSSHSPMATKSTPKLTQPKPERSSVSSTPHLKPEIKASHMRAPQQPPSSVPNMHGHPSMSPFSMSLPMESQMLLGSALDPNDPMTSMFMAGSENMPMPFNYNDSTLTKPRGFHQPFDGMSATLAPSALDMSPSPHSYTQAPPLPPPSASTMHLGNFDDFSKGFGAPNSSTPSGTVTPGIEGGWDAYINDNSWSDNVT